MCYIDQCGLLKHLKLLTWAACVLQKWVNPMQAPVQSRLPSLEDLTCGNTTGIRPRAITRAQLMTAKPLQQVHSSSCDGFTHPSAPCLPSPSGEGISGFPALNSCWLEEREGESRPFNLDRLLVRELSHCAHRAGVQWAKCAWRCTQAGALCCWSAGRQ